jgi:hypothetical protein
MAPGAAREVGWSAIITLLSKRNGETCSLGPLDLPAGRYRLKTHGVPAGDPSSGTPIEISRDFELPTSDPVIEVPFAFK